jgi:hypothetical protein
VEASQLSDKHRILLKTLFRLIFVHGYDIGEPYVKMFNDMLERSSYSARSSSCLKT